MQVRVFQSPDMASGLRMIKQELGPDALILSTKTIRNGKLGLLGKPMLEITAAVDNEFSGSAIQEPSPRSLAKEITFQKRPESPGRNKNGKRPSFRHVVSDPVEQYLASEPEPAQPPQPAFKECFREYPSTESREEPTQPERVMAAPAEPGSRPGGNSAIESEVNELKMLVKQLAGQISELNTVKETPSSPQLSEHSRGAIQIPDSQYIPRVTASQVQGDFILSMLIERGINVESARTITGFLRESLTAEELANTSIVQSAIIETLQNLIEVSPPDLSPQAGQKRLALVGPTGVGKTTTLAKIAASYIQQYSRSIALITIDTYRIAAVEQLKVYGEIMHLPVEVVITPEQLEQAFARHQDKDLILIDTAGRSPRDTISIEELATFLTPDQNIEKHLVLSATTRENEIVESINQFDKLDIANTIFTKIDECTSLGVLLNAQIQNTNPISFVTNGQRVPEDLLPVSSQKVAELIMSQDEGSIHE